uniref:Uncharacterized protein n=1 Tax=Ditylenchus dipsaci TaxID=166011 RepID=A0A915DEL2_9BILA
MSTLSSPTQSTISLLNTQSNRGNMRSLSSSSASMQRRQPRPSYQLNESTSAHGVFHYPFHKEGETDYSFLGREWLFKELYQTAVLEKAPVTLILGANGSGKSAVLNQLVLNSPFFIKWGTNADTVDSGIVVGSTGSQTSLNSSTNFSSRNYEWLRMVACRVIAFHTCHLYCASTCSIPEFIRNICSYMCASPILRPYTERICSDDRLYLLSTNEAASLEVDPVELFRLLVIQPLAQLNVNQLKWESCCLFTNKPHLNGKTGNETADTETCLIVLIDGVDEAGFHRNDGDESIGWLLKQTSGEFPPWLRFIVTSSTVAPFMGWICAPSGWTMWRWTKECCETLDSSLTTTSLSFQLWKKECVSADVAPATRKMV